MDDPPKKMLSIWTWSALILAAYGVLLLAVGLWRLGTGTVPDVKLAHLHADTWWPVLMLVVAGGLFWAGRREQRAEE